MTTADLPITIGRERIARFCRERGIRTLSLFGSVLRGDFDPSAAMLTCSRSLPLAPFVAWALRYFVFADELGSILGHKVDFCSQLHPAFRDRIVRAALTIYERS